MFSVPDLGKMLIGIGITIVFVGIIFLLLNKIPLLGKLPGDIFFQTENLSCFIPIVSSIVLSIVLTVVINLILRIMNRLCVIGTEPQKDVSLGISLCQQGASFYGSLSAEPRLH
jgi:uncharacterized membrane protein